MRLPLVIVIVIFFTGCNNNSTRKKSEQISSLDSNLVAKPVAINKDSLLMAITKEVLTAFKNKNYVSLSLLIHPEEGVRFSPYAFIQLANDKVVKPDWIKSQADFSKQVNVLWGTNDGSNEAINKTLNEYVTDFVYDVDFLNPEKIKVNEFIGGGNTLNNLLEVYSNCDFSESHFSGFDKKYGGMDWRSLRLVFKMKDGKYYLAGVIHDEWTI